ncbi:hypothetical protein CRM22_005869 [Opisthorchis felineus]|uniref:Replication factor A protein 3 n=1 Tax=Opisthorchis felineus TaxID=147828 RepID=A0A4S2LP26_OPIFE|nr:hypothetical protein CRM22_005869 [Opisthorchis felineus]
MDRTTGARFRVTGAMLPNLVGRDVCVVGTVLNVASTGQRLRLRCVDGREIECNLQSQLQTSPENCVAELQGRVRNPQGTELDVTAEPILFSKEASEKFDADLYAQAVQLTAQFDRFYLQPMET